MSAVKKPTESEVQVELLDPSSELIDTDPQQTISEIGMPSIAPTIPAGANLSQPIDAAKPITSAPDQPREPTVSNWASEIDDSQIETTVDRQTSKWIVMIVVLVLLILAAAGGVVYYLTQYGIQGKSNTVSPAPDTPAVQPAPPQASDEQTTKLNQIGTEDNLDSIKKDVDSTNINSLDTGLDEIESEL